MLIGLDKLEGLTPELIEQINGLAGGLITKNAELLGKVTDKDSLSASEVAKLKGLEDFKANAEIQAAKEAETGQKQPGCKPRNTRKKWKNSD